MHYTMIHPRVFVASLLIAVILLVISMLMGSQCEVTARLRSPAGFWFFGLISGILIGAALVLGLVLASSW
jgi:hypothetical protein